MVQPRVFTELKRPEAMPLILGWGGMGVGWKRKDKGRALNGSQQAQGGSYKD